MYNTPPDFYKAHFQEIVYLSRVSEEQFIPQFNSRILSTLKSGPKTHPAQHVEFFWMSKMEEHLEVI